MPGLQRSHPIMKSPFVSRLSKASLTAVILLFMAASLAAISIVAYLIFETGRPRESFGESFRFSLANAWNPGDLLERPGQTSWCYVAGAMDAFAGILLPTFLLGAFVFKLFQDDPIAWRKTVSVENLSGRPMLRFRFYNATRSPIVRVEIIIYARVRLIGEPGTLRNYRLPVVLRSGTVDKNESWAFGRPGVPYLVSVPLWDADGESNTPAHEGPVGRSDAASYDSLLESENIYIPPYGEPTAKKNVSFMALASGVSLDTGQPFVSMAEYSASRSLLFGHYQEIGVEYGEAPRKWTGWHNFDGNGTMYVFGYGSLTKPESVAAEFNRTVNYDDMIPAELRGWRRAWNVGSDRYSHPERTIYNADGALFDGVVAVLGLIHGDTNMHCNGAVFPVSSEDLAKLDVRERNYHRVDVSQAVTFKGKPDDCVVFVYVPRVEAMERLEFALKGPKRRPTAIRKAYLEQTRAGFALMGDRELRQFDADPIPITVHDLRFEYKASGIRDVDDRTDGPEPKGVSAV